jgi:hypothetical protein
MGLISGVISAASAILGFFTGKKSTTTAAGGTAATTATTGTANTGSGILNTIDNLLTSGTTATADAAGMFGSAAAFMEALTDGRMWRSLGWLVAGLMLVILGFVLWVRGDLAPPIRPRVPGPY